MEKLTKANPEARSADMLDANVTRLRELFPEAVREGRIDFEVLRQLLGDEVDDHDEKYGLSWNGKRRARQLSFTPSLGTLRPSPEESIDWETTKNLFIEGDNLEVLKLLQKSYANKVKLIYIDPPYNTGKDFVYKDDFRDSIKNYQMLVGTRDAAGRAIEANTESSGRFHTDWLNMMLPRLRLARNFLREDGFIAVSISDSEVHNLRALLDEIFGEQNLVETFIWESIFRPSNMSRRTRKNAEYVLLYAKNSDRDFELIERMQKPLGDASLTQNNNPPRTLHFPELSVAVGLSDGKYPAGHFGEVELLDPLHVKHGRNTAAFRLAGRFKWSQEYLYDEICSGVSLVIKSESMIPYYRKTYKQTALRPTKIIPRDLVKDVLAANAELSSLFSEVPFQYPKPISLITFLANCIGTTSGDTIMDFFAGSGTTGHAVMAMNTGDSCDRSFVLVQIPQPLDSNDRNQQAAAALCASLSVPSNLAELTKERLRRAASKLHKEHPGFSGDLGFRVLKLDASNLRAWNGESGDMETQLDLHADDIVAGRTDQDILYELLLKLGLDLCAPIETRTITLEQTANANKAASGSSSVASLSPHAHLYEVHSAGEGVLMVCLAPEIPSADVEPLGHGIVAWSREQNSAGETQMVFRDSAFENDVAKTNMTAILEHNGIRTVRSL